VKVYEKKPTNPEIAILKRRLHLAGNLPFAANKNKISRKDTKVQSLELAGLTTFFAAFVLQREVFKHFDEDSRPREGR
jgi:hypothetical protein